MNIITDQIVVEEANHRVNGAEHAVRRWMMSTLKMTKMTMMNTDRDTIREENDVVVVEEENRKDLRDPMLMMTMTIMTTMKMMEMEMAMDRGTIREEGDVDVEGENRRNHRNRRMNTDRDMIQEEVEREEVDVEKDGIRNQMDRDHRHPIRVTVKMAKMVMDRDMDRVMNQVVVQVVVVKVC